MANARNLEKKKKEVGRYVDVPESWAEPSAPMKYLSTHAPWTERSPAEQDVLHKAVSNAVVLGNNLSPIPRTVAAIETLADSSDLGAFDPKLTVGALGGGDEFFDGLESIQSLSNDLKRIASVVTEAKTLLAAISPSLARVRESPAAMALLGLKMRTLVVVTVVRMERRHRLSPPVRPDELEALFAAVVWDAHDVQHRQHLLNSPRASVEAFRTALRDQRGHKGGKRVTQNSVAKISQADPGGVARLEKKIPGSKSSKPTRKT